MEEAEQVTVVYAATSTASESKAILVNNFLMTHRLPLISLGTASRPLAWAIRVDGIHWSHDAKATPKLAACTRPRSRQQRGDPAPSSHRCDLRSNLARCRPAREAGRQAPDTCGRLASPPSRLRPAPARRAPRSSRCPGDQRTAARRRGFLRGQGGIAADAKAARPGTSPRLRNQAGRGSRSEPAAGLVTATGAGTRLPAAGPAAPAGAALLATAAATPRPKAEGPGDSSQHAPRRRPRPRRRRRNELSIHPLVRSPSLAPAVATAPSSGVSGKRPRATNCGSGPAKGFIAGVFFVLF